MVKMANTTAEQAEVGLDFGMVKRLDLVWGSIEPPLESAVAAMCVDRLSVTSWKGSIHLHMAFVKTAC